MIQKKEIVLYVILTIITCGIFGIVWFINITDDTAKLSGDNEMSGGKAFLFTLLTCGIYGIYWAYKIGQQLYKTKTDHNIQASDNSVIYLILQFFGLGIIVYCLAQNDINEIIDNSNIN